MPGTMSATWLSGKTGDAGGQAQPAELVLNTPDRNFWLARRGGVDAGIGPSPLQAQAAPVSGWTLGVMAHALVGAFHLPPEIVNADPLASEVSGQAAVRFPACRVRSMLRSHTASGRT